MFKGLNNNIEAYIDGMTMKIQTIHNHLSNQEETFNTIKGFICAKTLLGNAFSIHWSKVLCIMIHQKGININSKKVKAVSEMKPLSLVKEV